MKETLIVHETEVSRILGKRAARLNEFREKYGAKIKIGASVAASDLIPVNIEPASSDGDGAEVRCKQAIVEYLNSFEDHYTGNRDEMESDVGVKPDSGPIHTNGTFPVDNISGGFGGSPVGRLPSPPAKTVDKLNQSGDNFVEPKAKSPELNVPSTVSGMGRGRLLHTANDVNKEILLSKPVKSKGERNFGSPLPDDFDIPKSGFGSGFEFTTPFGFGFQNAPGSKGGFDNWESDMKRHARDDNSDDDENFGFGSEFTSSDKMGQMADTSRGLRGGGFQSMLEDMRKKTFTKQNLPPLVKDVYQEHPDVSAMLESEIIRIRKEKNDVQVRDLSDADRYSPRIVQKFEHVLQPYPELLAEVRRNGFPEPTPIQCQMWPVLFTGYDCIGIAQTGTGKTLAFLFPAFIHIESQAVPRKERTGPTVLVLSPTRELAQQIEREVRKYNYKNISSVCLYGGGSRREQVSVVSDGVDIVIATPGRLNDLICEGDLTLDYFSYVVLDEADRMLDMGFEPQIKDVLGLIRDDRHTVMTSATWPPQVQRLALKYMKDPMLVSIGSLDLKACHNVTQEILVVQEHEKKGMLGTILQKREKNDKFLIFCGKKRTVDTVSDYLSRNGHENMKMHGDIMQCDRERALRRLKKGTVRMVVASDVAARGLDIMDITHVINYDMANNNDDYVHRIGRTARAGKKGTAVTFFTSADASKAPKVIEVLEEAKQVVPPELRALANSWGSTQESYTGWGRYADAPSCNARSIAAPPSRQRTRQRSPPGFYDPCTGEKIGTLL